MILNKEMIEAIGIKGNWNYTQMKLLGVSAPPPKGWKQKLIGRYIDEDTWNLLHAISGMGQKKRAKILAKEPTLF